MLEAMEKAYSVLDDVFRKGAFVNIAIKKAECTEKQLMTGIVYGTVERYYECEYIISKLARSVKPALKSLLYECVYMIGHMRMPAYAVVDAAVNTAGKIFGSGVRGFVNAVLKNVAAGKVVLPESGNEYEKIKYNAPNFIIEKLRSDGFDPALFLLPVQKDKVHFRIGRLSDVGRVLSSIADAKVSPVGGYVASACPELEKLSAEGVITFQSPSSIECVKAFGDLNGKKLLDVCAAPGGKAVFAAQSGAEVTALDIYPHRVGLIRSYAERMGVKLTTKVADATIFDPNFSEAFDCVLADVPCSGLGVVSARPDITLNKTENDFVKLCRVQAAILKVASKYVAPGGRLVYSTCTPLKDETENRIREFVSENVGFRVANPTEDSLFGRYIYPDEIMDGFFVSVLERI